MDSKNKLFKLGEVSYYYLPYEIGGEEQFLRIMEHDGKVYINLSNVDTTNPEKTFTCRIFSASSKDINDQSLLSLEVEADGELRTITLPVNTDGISMISTINNLALNNDVTAEIIENAYECPNVDNFFIDQTLNSQPVGEKGEIRSTERLKSGSRKGQALQKTEVSVGGKSLTGLGQEIDTEKLGLKTKQVVSLLDSKSYDDADGTENVLKDALLTITSQDSSKPIAVFAREKKVVGDAEKEVTTFRISTEFLTKFIENNPSLANFPLGEKFDDEYISYDVDQLKLSENLTIEDVQIRAASEQFAVMFSALGMQLVDKDKNLGKFANTETPFNIGVTTNFLGSALSNQPGLLIERKGKGFDALLISAIQQKRQAGNESHNMAKKTVSMKFDEAKIELYSVPIVLKDTEGKSTTEYLSIKKDLESGKSYIYMHSTNELPRSKTVPQFHEIDIVHLEENNNSTLDGAQGASLFIGFKSGKSANRANIEIDYAENADTLKTLKTVLDGTFERTPDAGSEHSTAMFAGAKRKIGDEEYTIYSRPTESTSEILSLSDVAILKSTTVEDEDPDGHVEKSGFISDPPVVEPPAKTTDKPVESDEDNGGQQGEDDKDKDKDKDKGNGEQDEPDENLEDIKWSTKIGKPKAKPSSTKKILIGFFALGTLLSMVVPILGIVSGILAGAIVFVDVKPWIVKTYKEVIEENNKARNKKDKDIREFERVNAPRLEKHNGKKLEKSRKQSKKFTSLIVQLERQKLDIQNNPKLTDAQKLRMIKAIDKRIDKNKKSLEKETFKQQYLLKEIAISRQKTDISKKVDALKKKEEEIEAQRDVRAKNIQNYKNNSNEIQKRIDTLKTKGIEKKKSELKETKKKIDAERKKREQQKLKCKETAATIQKHIDELKAEQSNMAELESLNNKLASGATLSDAELQKLEELRKKLKKSKKQKSSDYTSEISSYQAQLDSTNDSISSLEKADRDERKKENDLLQQLDKEIVEMQGKFKNNGGIGCEYDSEIVHFEKELEKSQSDLTEAENVDISERENETAVLRELELEIASMRDDLNSSEKKLEKLDDGQKHATGENLTLKDFVLPDEEGLLKEEISEIESANDAQRKRIEARSRRDAAKKGDSGRDIN